MNFVQQDELNEVRQEVPLRTIDARTFLRGGVLPKSPQADDLDIHGAVGDGVVLALDRIHGEPTLRHAPGRMHPALYRQFSTY